jgi:RimJ/RimL family protein N-acetyltransferase
MVESDVPAVLAVFDDPHARRFYPDMIDPAAAARWIAANRERYRRDGFGLWALVERTSGALVGDCGLTWQDVEGAPRLEIGYHIAAPWRGRGLALEAARAVLANAFLATSEDEIGSIVAPDNHASIAVAKRLHGRVRPCVNARGLDRLFFITLRQDRQAGG